MKIIDVHAFESKYAGLVEIMQKNTEDIGNSPLFEDGGQMHRKMKTIETHRFETK